MVNDLFVFSLLNHSRIPEEVRVVFVNFRGED